MRPRDSRESQSAADVERSPASCDGPLWPPKAPEPEPDETAGEEMDETRPDDIFLIVGSDRKVRFSHGDFVECLIYAKGLTGTLKIRRERDNRLFAYRTGGGVDVAESTDIPNSADLAESKNSE